MAVWIYAYAKNGRAGDTSDQQYIDLLNAIPLDATVILDSIRRESPPGASARQYYNGTENRNKLELWLQSLSTEDYHAYLDSIKLPHIEKAALIDRFITDAEQRDQEDDKHFHAAYTLAQSQPASAKWTSAGNGVFINRLHYFTQNYDGLRVSLRNDLVWITGPFAIFSKFFIFLQHVPPAIRDYYHSYFKEIAQAFNSDFILYAHEWSGMDDEDNEAFDLAELRASSDWENNTSDSLATMDKFYYEKL